MPQNVLVTMRFQIVFHVKPNQLLPINYQYPLSSWIYKTLNRSDSEFTRFLHDEGYILNNRTYKLFNFSQLSGFRYERIKDRLKLLSDEVRLLVSFLVPQPAEHFITGLFKDQQVTIGDLKSHVTMEVIRIEARHEDIPSSEKIKIRSLSPIIVSKPGTHRNGKLYAKYLDPEDPEFGDRLIGNLLNKYTIAAEWGLVEKLNGRGTQETIEFEANGQSRSRLITIAAGTDRESKLRGYQLDYKLAAPAALIRVGLEAGFGEKNSLGFGCGEVVG